MTAASRLLLAAILLLAAGLRAWNLDAGVGTRNHPDEPHKAAAAATLAREGFTDTGYFNHPYLLLEGTVAAGIGWADRPRGHHLAGRIFSALCGVLTVLAVFLLAREFSERAAHGAALLAAVVPIAVVHSRYLKEDAALGLFTTAALLFSVRAIRSGALRDLALATAAAALALSTKWTGGLALLLPAAVLARRGSPRRAAAMAGLAAGIFLLLNPQVLLFPAGVGADLRWEGDRAATAALTVPVSSLPWAGGYHLVRSLAPGMTIPLLLAGLAGLVLLARTREPGALLLAGFAGLWYAAHEVSPLKPAPDAMRYMVPLAPLLCVGAAALPVPRAALLAMVLALWPAWRSVSLAVDARLDTRQRALEWAKGNLSPGAGTWTDPYGPAFGEDPWVGTTPPGGPARPVVFVSSFWRDRFLERGAGPAPEARAFLDRVEGWPVLATFEAPSGPFAFQNPRIRVYAAPKR